MAEFRIRCCWRFSPMRELERKLCCERGSIGPEAGNFAKRIVDLIAPGRVFFCNSGAEANEGLFKFSRKFGHDDGRYEIITTTESFHGRTLAGIAATGQEKVKKGFEPAVAGFKQVPFNDLDAMRGAITPKTAAILIEPVQGESGITIASAEYLIGLRGLCDERNLLLRELQRVQQRFPKMVKVVRGLGLMIGIELQPQFKAVEMVKELHNRNLLTVPAGNSVIRLLPPLNLRKSEAEEGLRIIEKFV